MEFDLECNSPCDFGDIEDDEQGNPSVEESEGLNEAELLFLSDAGDAGAIKEQLPAWLQREEEYRCPRACYQDAQEGARKLLSRKEGVQWILKVHTL
jgi:hypothetical protein